MTDVELVEPTAPEAEPAAQAVDDAPAPVATAPDDERYKKLRDRMAEQGRRNQELERQHQAQQQQIAQLTELVNRQGATLNAMEQARVDAYLNSITDPGERAVEEVKILKRQLQQTAGMNRPVPPSTPTPQTVQPTPEQIRARAQEILTAVNTQFGTNLGLDDTDEDGDPIYDWDNPDTFKASAMGAARALKKVQKETPMAKKEPDAATTGKQTEPRLSSPAAPRPVPNPRNTPIDTTKLVEIATAGSTNGSRVSPRKLNEQLKQAREQAAARLPNT